MVLFDWYIGIGTFVYWDWYIGVFVFVYWYIGKLVLLDWYIGIGTFVFGILTWSVLHQAPTLKTIICLLLAAAIVLIQITNVAE